jgi:hypothetical protein
MRSNRFRRVNLMIILLLAGCGKSGPQLAPVRGLVTLDGQPVFEAQLIFQPDEGQGSPSYGVTDKDGQYEVGYKRDQKGALVGWHTVSITMDWQIVGPDGGYIRRAQAIPPRYNTQSELRREVERGKENVFEFELKSDPNDSMGRGRRRGRTVSSGAGTTLGRN